MSYSDSEADTVRIGKSRIIQNKMYFRNLKKSQIMICGSMLIDHNSAENCYKALLMLVENQVYWI